MDIVNSLSSVLQPATSNIYNSFLTAEKNDFIQSIKTLLEKELESLSKLENEFEQLPTVKQSNTTPNNFLLTQTSSLDTTVTNIQDTKINPKTEVSLHNQFDSIIQNMSEKYKVPFNLVKNVINAESSFNPNAVSVHGALGLMQLMPKTASWLGIKDPLNPVENIEGGVKYLSSLLQKYNGNPQLALAAYNAGPGNVDKYGGVPPFKETQDYITKILG